MKRLAEFTVLKSDLVTELQHLRAAIAPSTIIPALGCVLIEADAEGKLRLSGTDLEVEYRASCVGAVIAPGKLLVGMRKLLDYVKLLPAGEITFRELDNHWAAVRCGRSSAKIVGLSVKDFPEAAAAPTDNLIHIPSSSLLAMGERVIFAIGDESRYTTNGALLVVKPGALRLVATDGHRIAHALQEHLILEGATGETKALIPRHALLGLMRLLQDAPDGSAVKYAETTERLFFFVPAGGGMPDRLVMARRPTGQFPNYEAVLPKTSKFSLNFNRESMLGALRRVGEFTSSNAIRMEFRPDKVILTAADADLGNSEEEVDAEGTSNTSLVTGFNAKYLLDFLQAVEDETVTVQLTDELKAAEFNSAAGAGGNLRYVVMPMRVQ